MPIKDLQQRLTQIGVIRLGQQLISKNNKPYPHKLETFRFTSPSRPLIDRVAELYGGTVQPWASPAGPQWEVITGVKEIPVLVPPQRVDPNHEMWGKGFKSRLCDGETERIRDVPCMCLAQFGPNFTKVAPPGGACKPTTRMSLMLADLLSLGTWKLESHGWNAAAELPTLVNELAEARKPIPGRLEIQARGDKTFDPSKPQDKQVETRNYMVPVLHIDFVTPSQAFSGQIDAAARTALTGGDQRQAIGSTPTEPQREKLTAERVLVLAKLIKNVEQMQDLWRQAATDDVLTDEVKADLTRRAEALKPKPAAEAAPQPPVDVVVDAEIVNDRPEPDGRAAWNEIIELAGQRGWNMPALEKRFVERMGFDYRDDQTTGWKLAEFRDAVKAGEIQ